MGCRQSMPVYVENEKSIFISRHISDGNNLRPKEVALIFKCIIADANARNAFYKYLKWNYSTINIDFCETVEYLKGLTGEEADSEVFFNQCHQLYEYSTYDSLTVSDAMKSKLQRFGKVTNANVMSRDVALELMNEAQTEVIQSMDALIPKFERSKEFSEYIVYYSQPAVKAAAPKTDAEPVASKSTMSAIFKLVAPAQRKSSKRSTRLEKKIASQDNRSYTRRFFNKKVLVVESVSILAKILICKLQSTNFEVFHAVNEKEALVAISQHTFDIILYSLDVTEGGGFEAVLKGYREQSEKNELPMDKFIAMVSDANSPRIERALQMGFNKKVLVKPFSIVAFREALRG